MLTNKEYGKKTEVGKIGSGKTESGKNPPKIEQNILLHNFMIMHDIGINSISCCLKMK